MIDQCGRRIDGTSWGRVFAVLRGTNFIPLFEPMKYGAISKLPMLEK